jgi:hypothetical protein
VGKSEEYNVVPAKDFVGRVLKREVKRREVRV